MRYQRSSRLFNEAKELPTCMYYDAPLFHMPRISPKLVYEELLRIKSSTATGSDDLPAIFLIKCVDVLSVPLSRLFNSSIDSGVYPDILKYNNQGNIKIIERVE